MIGKIINQKGWFFVLPVVILVAFNALIPLMTVVNYSVQDIISPEQKVFVGLDWFRDVMLDSELHAALLRQLIFSFCVLRVQLPLGIGLALILLAAGWIALMRWFREHSR